MKNIVWTRSDGGVSITYIPEDFEKTSKELAQTIDVPVGFTAVAYDVSVSEARDFRDAWTWNNGLTVDMDKAKEIHKGRLRKAREPVLAALDVEFMRALEQGNAAKQSEVSRKKQELRDVTNAPQLVNARTPDELREFWPESLA